MNGTCSTQGENETYRPIQNLVRISSAMRPLGRLTLEDNIKMNFRETGCKTQQKITKK
jgi:hypothetical protein